MRVEATYLNFFSIYTRETRVGARIRMAETSVRGIGTKKKIKIAFIPFTIFHFSTRWNLFKK